MKKLTEVEEANGNKFIKGNNLEEVRETQEWAEDEKKGAPPKEGETAK